MPKNFPALLRGEKVCKRASRAGLPINNPAEYAARIKSALDKLESSGFEVNSQNQQTYGDMLLDFCNLDRILKIDGEKALTYSTNKFIIDFSTIEKMALEQGKKLDDMSTEVIRAIMNKVFDGR